jgi:hypothetical protein
MLQATYTWASLSNSEGDVRSQLPMNELWRSRPQAFDTTKCRSRTIPDDGMV